MTNPLIELDTVVVHVRRRIWELEAEVSRWRDRRDQLETREALAGGFHTELAKALDLPGNEPCTTPELIERVRKQRIQLNGQETAARELLDEMEAHRTAANASEDNLSKLRAEYAKLKDAYVEATRVSLHVTGSTDHPSGGPYVGMVEADRAWLRSGPEHAAGVAQTTDEQNDASVGAKGSGGGSKEEAVPWMGVGLPPSNMAAFIAVCRNGREQWQRAFVELWEQVQRLEVRESSRGQLVGE